MPRPRRAVAVRATIRRLRWSDDTPLVADERRAQRYDSVGRCTHLFVCAVLLSCRRCLLRCSVCCFACCFIAHARRYAVLVLNLDPVSADARNGSWSAAAHPAVPHLIANTIVYAAAGPGYRCAATVTVPSPIVNGTATGNATTRAALACCCCPARRSMTRTCG